MIDLKFSKCITSPHTIKYIWENTSEGILARLEDVKLALPDLTAQLKLTAISEYIMDDELIRLMESKPLLTLKDKYVLVEMSYLNPPIQLYSIIYELQLAGYIPILAHPERYTFYHHDFEQLSKLKKTGCLFQLNLLSVVGYYGKKVAEIADQLLEKDMIDFTGSDIHHEKHIEAFYNKTRIKNVRKLEEIMGNNFLFK